MLFAIVIVKCDLVLAAEFAQAQVACGMVVTIWFTVLRAAEPPRRAIGGAPHTLLLVSRVHWRVVASATTVTILGDVNDPTWSPECWSRCKESRPVSSACRSEDLGAFGAAVLVQRFVHVKAVRARNQWARSVVSIKSHAFALTPLGAAWVRFRGYL